jgi:hypothetical protein
MKAAKQSKTNEEELTSTYTEDEYRKKDTSHPLCGVLVEFDYDLFTKEGFVTKKTGEEKREGFVMAVYNDLVEIVLPESKQICFIPTSKIHDLFEQF